MYSVLFKYNRVQAVKKGESVRSNYGPKTKLSRKNENDMAAYLEECWDFGMPKRKEDFKNEIVHFMECNHIPNTFPNTKPGNGLFTYMDLYSDPMPLR